MAAITEPRAAPLAYTTTSSLPMLCNSFYLMHNSTHLSPSGHQGFDGEAPATAAYTDAGIYLLLSPLSCSYCILEVIISSFSFPFAICYLGLRLPTKGRKEGGVDDEQSCLVTT